MSLATTYTTTQVAEMLQVTEWWVRRQVQLDRVRPLRLGGDNSPMRFTDADVERLLASMRPPAPMVRKRRRQRRAS